MSSFLLTEMVPKAFLVRPGEARPGRGATCESGLARRYRKTGRDHAYNKLVIVYNVIDIRLLFLV